MLKCISFKKAAETTQFHTKLSQGKNTKYFLTIQMYTTKNFRYKNAMLDCQITLYTLANTTGMHHLKFQHNKNMELQ
jgi:hypothetical protein